ncbi:MAG: hypothetical protein A2Y88_00715 [Chloroflexi bacterium RBG_13_48_10]|nr:MAG: hypothetical protein A2Y88_00715 [Chloroflexi bacterium RBG_13_48_10]
MKIKNLLLSSTFLILILAIAACSEKSNQAASTTSTDITNGSQDSASLSQVNMLLVGTLKLEDTDQAISADQAATLLPLWQAYRSLSNSQTAAEAEVEALLNQIQNSMSADQVQAIKAMNLTNSDMIYLMQTMGGGMMGRGTPNPQGTPGFDLPAEEFMEGPPPSGDFQFDSGDAPSVSGRGTMRNFPSGGVIIEGGPGGGAGDLGDLGGGPALQGTPDPAMQATAQARFSTQANRVNTMLLNVLISKLETKAAG